MYRGLNERLRMFVLVLTLIHEVCCLSTTIFHPHNVIKSKVSRFASISSLSCDLHVDLHLRIICYRCTSKANMLFSGRGNAADRCGHCAAILFILTRSCRRVRLTVTHSHQDSCSSDSSRLIMKKKCIIGSTHSVPVSWNSVSRLNQSQSDRLLLRCLHPLTFML